MRAGKCGPDADALTGDEDLTNVQFSSEVNSELRIEHCPTSMLPDVTCLAHTRQFIDLRLFGHGFLFCFLGFVQSVCVGFL
jgi:hypothetical protein